MGGVLGEGSGLLLTPSPGPDTETGLEKTEQFPTE